MFIFIISILIVFAIWYSIFSVIAKVNAGPPPIKKLIIAYKYVYLDKFTNSSLNDLIRSYPNNKIVKFCYSGPKSCFIEFAHGVVINEYDAETNIELMDKLIKDGMSLFSTPDVSHAVYSEYPLLPWLGLTRWIAIATAYKRHYNYAQQHNLCAYPVIEVYSKYSLLILLPLVRQDEFVVSEAEQIVFGHSYPSWFKKSPITTKDILNHNQDLVKYSKSPRKMFKG